MKKRVLSVLIIITMVLTLSENMGNVVRAADVQDTASLLSMNGQWSKDYWLTDDEDAHYYKIVIPGDGYFSFKIMSYIGGWCYYDLYSGDLSEQYWDNSVRGGTETSPNTASYWTSLSKGTYILKIHSGDTGRYRLQSSYKNYHVNDANAVSYDSPQEFTLGSTITGALTESDREDWYRIRVPKTGYYTFFCKNYVDHWFYYSIYSSDLLNAIMERSIYGADETEPKTQQNDIVLKAGTYYIKVYGSKYSKATGRYVLKWDSLKQSNCDHSYKAKWVYPTYTHRGYTLHKCEKCGKSYKDNYSSQKKLGNVSGYVVPMRRKVKVTWYMVEDASGYQIRYSTNRKMKKSVKTVTLKGKRKTKKTIKKLRSGKSYYFQVRAYRNEGQKKIYGRWSSKRKVRVG